MANPTLIPAGSTRFEQARARLAARRDTEPELVTDAEVLAYLKGPP